MQIYFYISIFGILLTMYLVYFNIKRNTSIIYLGLFFLFLSFYSLSNFVIYRSASVFLISIFYINLGHFGYLIGPMSYLYIRSVINDNASFRKKDIWHLVPAIFSLIISLPYMFSDYQHKVEIAQNIARNYHFIETYRASIIADYIPNEFIYLSRPVLILYYAVISVFLLTKHFIQQKSVKPGETIVRKWLVTFLVFQILMVVFYIITMYNNFYGHQYILSKTLENLNFLTNISMVALMISPTLFPRILYGLPIIQSEKELISDDLTENKAESAVSKHAPVFETKYMIYLDTLIDVNMQEHHLFIQSKINLNELGLFLNIPVYHLKYYFSVYKQQTFKDFCDKYRVDHAKKLMKDSKFKTMTLEAIAISSGFHNRNSFTKAFQKQEGKSPSAYSLP